MSPSPVALPPAFSPTVAVRFGQHASADAAAGTTFSEPSSQTPPAAQPPAEPGWFQRAVVQPLTRIAQTIVRFLKDAWESIRGQMRGGLEQSIFQLNDRLNEALQNVDRTLGEMERDSRLRAAAQRLNIRLLNAYEPQTLLTQADLDAIVAKELAPRLKVSADAMASAIKARISQGVSDALRETSEGKPYDPIADDPTAITVSPEAPSGNTSLYARRRTFQLLNEESPHLVAAYLDRVVQPMYDAQIALPGVTPEARKAYDGAREELRAFYLADPSAPKPTPAPPVEGADA